MSTMDVMPRSALPGDTSVPGDLRLWKEREESAKRDRQRYEPTWSLCQSFVANRQWVGWSRRERRIVSEPNPQNRERHTVNVLTQYLMTNVGKILSDDLRPTLYPANDSIEARKFAKQANKALAYACDEEVDTDTRLYEAVMKLSVFGTSAVMPTWDPTRGPMIARQVPFIDGQPILDPQTAREQVLQAHQEGRLVEFRDVRGKLRWNVLSPYNILPPPGIEDAEDFPWLILQWPVPLEWLKMVYPQAAGVTEQDLTAVDMLGFRDLGDDMAGGERPGRLRDHAILSTGYERPTRQFQQGRTVVWSGQTKLEEKQGLPLSVNGEQHFGVRFLHYHRIPGRFWGIGCIEPGIGPQRQRNRSRSQYIELKDRAGLGRVYARPGSLNVGQLPGGKVMEVIEVRDGREYPQENLGSGPGPWLRDDIAMHDADLDKVMGMSQVSLGGTPGGVSAYSAMALLAEQDDRRIGPVLKSVRNEVGWVMRYTLELMRRYWPPDKQIMLAGQEDEIEAFVFNSSQLPSCYLLTVGKGAPAPRNQAAEVQKVFDIYDRSISGGQPLPISWLYDSIEQGSALPLPTAHFDIQREKAEIENLAMGKGAVLQPSPTDDHALHIAEHNAAIAAHQLIPGSEQMIALLSQHVQAHAMMRAQTASMAAEAPNLQGPQGAQGGRPAGGPAPTGPQMAPPGGG